LSNRDRSRTWWRASQAKNKLVYSWHQVLSICPDSPYRDPLFAGGLERSLGVSFSEFSECPVRGLVFFVLFVVLSFVRGHPPARHASPPGISRLQPRRTGKARRAGLCLRGKFYTPYTPKLYTLLYFPAKTRTQTTPNPKHFLRYQNSYLFVIISTFFLYPMPHAPCPMPLGTPIALI
jgi:hypothetical protein